MKQITYILLIIFAFSLCACKQKSEELLNHASLNIPANIVVKPQIKFLLEWKTKPQWPEEYLLFIQQGFFQTVLKPQNCQDASCEFILPKTVAQKTGVTQWKLLFKNQILDKGEVIIQSNSEEKKNINTYLGPPSAKAGTSNAAMAVSIATDAYGNLIMKNDSIDFNFRYDNTIFSESSRINKGLAFAYINAGPKAKSLQLGSSYKKAQAKMVVLEVMPNQATNFKLILDPTHFIADGQQELKVSTSPITDSFGNLISDGTLVTLFVRIDNMPLSSVTAITINGVAQFTLLHPQAEQRWVLEANVSQVSKSAEESITFKPFTSSLPYNFNEQTDLLTVGPIFGPLNDVVSDGMEVSLYASDHKIDSKQTQDGKVNFYLNKYGLDNLKGVSIIAMGVKQSIE